MVDRISDDCKDTIYKIFDEHCKAESPFYSQMVDFFDADGWNSVMSAFSGNGLHTYPNILMPNGTLTQTFTTIGTASSVYSVGIRDIGKTNYNMGISLTQNTSFPDMYIGVFQQSTQISTQVSPPPFTGYRGVYLRLIGAGGLNPTCALHKIEGSITQLGSTVLQCDKVYFKVVDNKLSVTVRNTSGTLTSLVSNLDISTLFTNNDRYLQVYMNDGSSTGSTCVISQIASII